LGGERESGDDTVMRNRDSDKRVGEKEATNMTDEGGNGERGETEVGRGRVLNPRSVAMKGYWVVRGLGFLFFELSFLFFHSHLC
jgi:hypothetical protein